MDVHFTVSSFFGKKHSGKKFCLLADLLHVYTNGGHKRFESEPGPEESVKIGTVCCHVVQQSVRFLVDPCRRGLETLLSINRISAGGSVLSQLRVVF